MDMEGVHVHREGGEVEVHEVGVFAFVGDVGTVEVFRLETNLPLKSRRWRCCCVEKCCGGGG